MQQSVSFCLPVHNAQATLATTVAEILEVLPEVARSFELVIVDDASIDATPEIAHELATHYPQLRVVCQGIRQGLPATLERGLEESRGEVILLREEDLETELTEMLRIWQRVDATPQTIPQPPRMREDSVQAWIRRATQWGQQRKRPTPTTPQREGLGAALRQGVGLRWLWARRDELIERLAMDRYLQADSTKMPAGLTSHAAGSLRRPNYLGALRDFAWGE